MGKKATFYLLYNLSILGTVLLAVLAFGGRVAVHSDPAEYPLVTFWGLALSAILPANLLLAVYWLVRRKIWVVVPLLALALNWTYVSDFYRISFSGAEDAQPRFRVATLNSHAFRMGNYEGVVRETAHFFNRRQADIVCLQEFVPASKYGLDSIAVDFGFLPHVYHPLDHRGISELTVFSRYPITDCGFIPFRGSDNSALWIDVTVDGRKLRVLTAHLQTTGVSSARGQLDRQSGNIEGQTAVLNSMSDRILENARMRAEQVRILRRIIDTTTCALVVCGDFNDTPASYTYGMMKGRLTDGFHSNGSGFGATFRELHNLLRIDFILYNDKLKGVSYDSPDAPFSDHRPVIMGFDFRDE